MQPAQNPIEIYQLRVVLRETSPHIWRRFLVRSDSSIVDLHQTIQITFGWSGRRVFAFEVQGHRQGVRREGDPHQIRLSDFRFYVKERFTYTYNNTEQESRPWQFAIRLEQKLVLDARQHYPRCIGGVGASPPERCGGPIAFERLRDLFTPEYVVWRTKEMRAEGRTVEHDAELRQLQLWMHRKLDRRVINQQLRQVGIDTRKENPQP
jgi:hypothetical protein